jgi:hypothetical protein
MVTFSAASLIIPGRSCLAAGSPPSVDAGAAATLAFPAKDLTLFGHVMDPEDDPLVVTWTLASGPAAVGFSAPHAPTTTVTFTTTGMYLIDLAVSDGTSTVTSRRQVTVKPASSQTAFYVDPTVRGQGDGTAEAPWRSFEDGNPRQTAQWNAINRALATNDVIIYFSARQAGSDVAEEIRGAVRVLRTDKSNHRLTLDGMSKSNTNDSTPAWVDYTGPHKMRLRMTRGCCFSVGWDDDVPRDYITIRGFEVTGSGARVFWGGSHSVLEYMWVHDITTLGATVQFTAAVSEYPDCQDLGKRHAITLRKNLIERGIGEGIYLSGNYLLKKDGGCPSYGNTHSDILIEGNTIRDAGIHGEQGDGIDLKAGLTNVTVRDNLIVSTHDASGDDGGNGIVTLGTFASARTDYLLERNRILNVVGSGMELGNLHGAVIRNNIIANSAADGIHLSGETGFTNDTVQFYNNTIYGNRGSGIDITYATGTITLRNNLVIGNGSGGDAWEIGSPISSDYNLWAPSMASYAEGTHSLVHASSTGIMVNPAGGDFSLTSTSPARGKGVNLSSTDNLAAGTTWFNNDFGDTLRAPGTAWDIGAYVFGNGQPAPTAVPR